MKYIIQITTYIVLLNFLGYAQTRYWEDLNGSPNFSLLYESGNGTVFASYESSIDDNTTGLYMSGNNGLGWQKTQFGSTIEELTGYGDYVLISTIAFTPRLVTTRYFSADNGVTWATLSGTNEQPEYFAMTDSGKIYAFNLSQGPGGTSKSILNYEPSIRRWRQVGNPPPAVANNFIVDHATNFFFGTRGYGVFFSKDRGTTWIDSLQGQYINALYLTSDNKIVVGAQPYGNKTGGVYISPDTGKTWNYLGLPSKTFTSFAEDSFKRIYANTNTGIYQYNDTTMQWQFLGPRSVAYEGFVSTHSNIMIASSSSQGVYRSSNFGQTWEKALTLASEDISAMHIDAQNRVYVGTFGNRAFTASGFGTGWSQVPAGSIGSEVNSFFQLDSNVYAGTDEGIFRTTNKGETWSNISKQWFGGAVYAVASNSAKIIFVGTMFGVYSSSDNGNSWYPAGLNTTSVNHIAIDGVNRIIASTAESGIFISQNNGFSWNYAGLGGREIYSLTVNYAGDIFAGGYGGINRSTDNGGSWVERTFDNSGVLTLATRGRRVFAGTFHGIYTSTDNGTTWSTVNQSGLRQSPVLSLTFDNDGNLLAGMYQGGVYRTIQSFTGVARQDETPKGYSLSQNYPNPFNPSTVIRYSLPASSYVTLKIFDLLGREVTTLVDGIQDAGEKLQEWNANGLPTGIYFYRLMLTGQNGVPLYSNTKKMLFIK